MTHNEIMHPTDMPPVPAFTEHLVPTAQGNIYARQYQGAGPAFVLMHGFPDNLHIYDNLIPFLISAGRRVVAFDFLGYGASDKPVGASYSFEQQADDLTSVVEMLDLGRVIPVVHDSSGIVGINFTLAQPERVEWLCILNSAYDDASPTRWPELIALFATESLSALALAVAQSPEQFGWLLAWQREPFREPLTESQRERFDAFMGPLVAENFMTPPGSGPAFAQLTSQFFAALSRNAARLPELGALDIPVKVIWGEFDPYLTAEMARDRASRFKHATLSLLPAGHWVQSDLPEEVAKEMLS